MIKTFIMCTCPKSMLVKKQNHNRLKIKEYLLPSNIIKMLFLVPKLNKY